MNKNNTCPCCGEKMATFCENCGWHSSGKKFSSASIVRPTLRPKMPLEVVLGIAVDRTGSSKKFQVGISKTLEIILYQLEDKVAHVACTLQSHGDLDYDEEIVLHTQQGNVNQTIEDANAIEYGGGGDEEEHHLDAIENLVNKTPWGANPKQSRSAIIAFITAETKSARSGTTVKQLGKVIREQGILLYLVCEATPILEELVDAAEGLMFTISNDPDPSDLQKIAAQLAASIIATLGKGGGTLPLSIKISTN